MLLRPKQVALLYSWRLRSYADVALLLKVAAAAGALLLAVGTPGECYGCFSDVAFIPMHCTLDDRGLYCFQWSPAVQHCAFIMSSAACAWLVAVQQGSRH